MMRLIFVVACVSGVAVAVDRSVNAPRYVNKRAWCGNNIKQIGLAMHNYHAAYGAFPPAYVADDSGRQLHSWRVLLLPFLEMQSLYDRYRFDEPWDGPHNITLLREMPEVFVCPANPASGPAPSTWTSYVVIRGAATMFPGAKSVSLEQVTDGLAFTIAVVEVTNVRIPWTKPEDLDLHTMSLQINDRDKPSVSSNHPGGANSVFADGAYHALRESISGIRLRALATIAGGETVSPDWSYQTNRAH
jgi:prepilin-type processing-associated H-X9-DG protein